MAQSAGAKVLFKLDAKSGFRKLKIDPWQSSQLCTFILKVQVYNVSEFKTKSGFYFVLLHCFFCLNCLIQPCMTEDAMTSNRSSN